MFSKVTHITLLVSNPEEALQFYVNKLGFKVHTDAMMEDGMRWLTLNLPEQPDVELCLLKPSTPEELKMVGKQGGGFPFISFETKDCKKTFEELKKRGVQILSEPETFPWGIGASFVDLYGNFIYVNQPLS